MNVYAVIIIIKIKNNMNRNKSDHVQQMMCTRGLKYMPYQPWPHSSEYKLCNIIFYEIEQEKCKREKKR